MLKSLNQIRLEKKSIIKFHFKKYYDMPSDTLFGDTIYYYILRYLKATSLKLFSVILRIRQLVLLLLRHSHNDSMYFQIWRNVY